MRPERVLVLGCGSVAQCTLPLLIRDLSIEPQRITIVDMADTRARVADCLALGVTFENEQVTRANLDSFLSARVGPGDLLLDLAWNIDNPTILQWCRDHGVRYLNTSVEVWDPYDDMASTHPLDRTLYARHMDLRRMITNWGDNSGATAVLEHGANPGLVSHFTKQALVEIAGRMLQQGIAVDAAALELALADEAFNVLAMLTGTKVIHISERDTQVSNVPKEVDEFVN
ncbi:MAG: saccharopine dehydrogenase NADP-binding domain-containing protein, partial [Ilumatobacteraceae bacterium]